MLLSRMHIPISTLLREKENNVSILYLYLHALVLTSGLCLKYEKVENLYLSSDSFILIHVRSQAHAKQHL